MKLISCHDGKLHALEAGAAGRLGRDIAAADAVDGRRAFRTGLPALDALPPGGVFARGAVHELLSSPVGGSGVGGGAPAMFVAAMLAARAGDKAVVWSDPGCELYPPAVVAMGIPLERLFLLHPADEAEELWAIAECLRCTGVGAVVAALPERKRRLNRVEARRLQLAAERGGGVGLLMRTARPAGRGGGHAGHAAEHAAVTRWFVRPARGERNVQRWRIQLIFGHGGRVGESVILEHHRDPRSVHSGDPRPRLAAHPVRPAAELADRPAVPPPAAGGAPGRAAAAG